MRADAPDRLADDSRKLLVIQTVAAHRPFLSSKLKEPTSFRWHLPSGGPRRERQGPIVTAFALVAREMLWEAPAGPSPVTTDPSRARLAPGKGLVSFSLA